MAKNLTDFFPTPAEINTADVLAVRKRLEALTAQFWPELDTRPNAVFGDLHLTPLAVLFAMAELGMARFRSDVNLANVARGLVYDEDFVRDYLRNFGVVEQPEIPARGTIRIRFNEDKDYAFSLDDSFTFNGLDFRLATGTQDPVIIQRTNTDGDYVLHQTDDRRYEVFLPVIGPAGSLVNDGETAVTSLTHTEIVDVKASGPFDSGLMPESLPQLAAKAQRIFATANLTSRSGIVSFMTLRFPRMLGASATISGDKEMIRPGLNPLGVLEGAVDIFIKSRAFYATGEALVPLVYDFNTQSWVGQLNLPNVPAFMGVKEGVFQPANFLNERGVNRLYAKSNHPYVDNLGISYSKHEDLGIRILDSEPKGYTASYLSDIAALVNLDGSQLNVLGEYTSHPLNAKTERHVILRMDEISTYDPEDVTDPLAGNPSVIAYVTDRLTGESGKVEFVQNSAAQPTQASLVKSDWDAIRFFNGFTITLDPVLLALDLSRTIGNTYEFKFGGRHAVFNLTYLYDPALDSVDALVQDPDNKPVNVSVLSRSCIMCHVTEFVVHYRLAYGSVLDKETARSLIAQYVNSVVYPESYEEAKISNLLNALNGATLLHINKRGRFYPSLAGIYVDKQGRETVIPSVPTTTLQPPVNDLGFGLRNVAYFLDPENIQFNVTVR